MATELRDQALQIWQAGVDAVRSDRLVRDVLQADDRQLRVCGKSLPWSELGRVVVVGAGKAGAGMVQAVEEQLLPHLAPERWLGWVNVPADCVFPTRQIVLHGARPAGVNEPIAEGVQGSERILELVQGITADDLCLVLLSGGGSALLPAPCAGISLADKQAVTRFLSAAGANIHELNTVRKQLSRIKGGGLGRALPAGKMMSLIISDVIGNPLDIIASGPTVPDSASPQDALDILRRFGAAPPAVPQAVFSVLEEKRSHWTGEPAWPPGISNHLIGHNGVALGAAAEAARQLGFEVRQRETPLQGPAEDAGRELAASCRQIREEIAGTGRHVCILSGGETVVHLTPTPLPRKGGRNQQLVLAAACDMGADELSDIAMLSGGTDGEDGPTDAAGAWLDAQILQRARESRLDPLGFLAIQNAYAFFEQTGGLIKTGPTHTNVMDVQVALIADNA